MPKLAIKKSLLQFINNNSNKRETKDIEKETDEIFLNYMENYA